MPYVVDRRLLGSRLTTQNQLDSSLGIVYSRLTDSYTSYECTYGYRTGKRADNKKPDARDVYSPPKGASLQEILKYRKDFIERSVTKLATNASTPAPTHFILSDMGNEFANTKLSVVAPENFIYTRGTTGTRYQMRNGNPAGTRWFLTDGSTALGQPFSDFGSYLSGKGISEFVGGNTTGLNQATVNTISAASISALSPIQVHAGVLTTLLEMVKGDIPGVLKQLRKHLTTIQLWKKSFKDVKQAGSAVGSAYLENVFGWAPIIRDVQAAIQILITLDSILFPDDNTRRTLNRVIHSRHYTSEGTCDWSGRFGVLHNLGGTNQVGTISSSGEGSYHGLLLPATYTAQETLDVRVTARFNTALVPNSVNNGHLDRMTELLGLNLTPEVLWDLTPWSWLVDWFANIGSVVGNLSNIHMSNVILNYAYSTFRREAVSAVWCRPSLSGSVSTGVQSFSGTFLVQYNLSQKVRFKASPYGFGTALSALSQSQWAILVALGLARAR